MQWNKGAAERSCVVEQKCSETV